MAEAQLKELNKNVKEAVTMMKLYMGNSAQIRTMTDKQKEALQKWFDVGEEFGDVVKQQRAFTERERDAKGRFLKKQEAFSFSVMGIAKSIHGLFTGMVSTIGKSLSGIFSGIGKHIGNIFSTIKSHFLGLFGEESELFDIIGSIKDTIKGFFGWFARGFMFIFKRTPSWAAKLIKIQAKALAFQYKQAKMELLEGSGLKKKAGIWGILGAVLMGIGGAIGAWLHRNLIALKQLPIFKKMVAWFSKIDDIPILGKLLKGIKWGFRWLGWPLTILLSIIDFVRGWAATEGDWQAKLFGGLNKMLMGFLSLPLDILGWVYDKVMNFFGVDSSGTGAQLKQWTSDFLNLVLEYGPIGMITDIIKGFQTGDWKGIIDKKMEKIMGIFTTILDFVAVVWNGFLDWATEKVKNLPLVGSSISNMIDSLRMERGEDIEPVVIRKDIPKLISTHEGKKIEMQKEQTRQLKKAVEETTDATKKNGKSTEGAVNAMTAISQGGVGGGVEQKQIPDELDNNLINLNNYGGEWTD